MTSKVKNAAVKAFERYPRSLTLWVTPDGQAFLHENPAKRHDANAVEVNRDDVMSLEVADDVANITVNNVLTIHAKNANDTIADIKVNESIEELELLLTTETRKTVVAAIEKRLAELKTPADDNTPQ